MAGLTTLAYFSVGINANGTLNESGAGWNGYESQALSTLITRAHAAGKRVVLTVNDFDQSSLNALTSNPAAATTLAKALIGAIGAKNFDGVNLDLEGQGNGDQAGLTSLVTTVADTLHFVDPHWQVTMDTYASAAADTSGFYDIAALAPVVDAFFVMEYSPNVAAPAQAGSPLTSSLFSDISTATQYAAAVPPGKVILGAPFFGIDWPTTSNTLSATATGPATTLDDSAITTSGHPLYWDPVTDTAWTAYQVGTQWHESFFDDPTSLYQIAHLADQDGLRGVGVWALGMEGTDPAMVSALDGVAPAISYATPAAPSTTTTTTSAPPVAAAAPGRHDDHEHDGPRGVHRRDVRGRVPGHHPKRRPVDAGTDRPERHALRGGHSLGAERGLRGTPASCGRRRHLDDCGGGGDAAVPRSHRGRPAQRGGGAERCRPQLPRQCQPVGRARCGVRRDHETGTGGVAVARERPVRLCRHHDVVRLDLRRLRRRDVGVHRHSEHVGSRVVGRRPDVGVRSLRVTPVRHQPLCSSTGRSSTVPAVLTGRRMLAGAAIVLCASLTLASCGGGVPAAPPASQGVVVDRPVPAIPLISSKGTATSLAAYRGKYIVLANFLTLCQDECPLVTGAFITLQSEARAAGLGNKVVFMEITVDPMRDTPARLRAYSKEFGADWPLLTGTPANLHVSLEVLRNLRPDRARGATTEARLVYRKTVDL